MKPRNIFFCMAILCTSCFTAFSQQFLIDLQGGLAYTSFPKSDHFQPPLQQGKIKPSASIKGLIDLSKWQVGLSIGYASMSHNYEVPFYLGPNERNYIAYDISVPMYPVFAFANYKFNFVKSFVYVGLNTGHLFFASKETNTISPSNVVPFSAKATPQSAVSGGLQAGYSIIVSDKFQLNAELGFTIVPVKMTFNSYSLSGAGYTTDNSLFYFIPATVGVQYAL
jgi:hypothetical protein